MSKENQQTTKTKNIISNFSQECTKGGNKISSLCYYFKQNANCYIHMINTQKAMNHGVDNLSKLRCNPVLQYASSEYIKIKNTLYEIYLLS